jgi:hypothetical protein
MKHWFNKNYRTFIITTFLIPIVIVAMVSISHVTKWYGLSNPLAWATYLSIGVEIAALSSLAAISANLRHQIYFPFGIVTLIQFIGNIFFSYSYIDITSQTFISWVELISPIADLMGIESTDLIGHKRLLSLMTGGFLPIISLSFLHMLVKFTEDNRVEEEKELLVTPNNDATKKELINDAPEKELIMDEVVPILKLSDEDLSKIETILNDKRNREFFSSKINNITDEVDNKVEDVITDEVDVKVDNVITDEVDVKVENNDLPITLTDETIDQIIKENEVTFNSSDKEKIEFDELSHETENIDTSPPFAPLMEEIITETIIEPQENVEIKKENIESEKIDDYEKKK